MGCFGPKKQTLPQVGPRAIPDIFLPDQPSPTPFTDEEFNQIPIQALGKILKNQTDWQAAWDIAQAAIQGYRDYIKSLFDEGKK